MRVVTTMDSDEPDESVFEVTLTPDGDGTQVVWEERGMPEHLLAAYGAGIQVHVEDLAAYLAGGERCDGEARFGELLPVYQQLAANDE
jgi:Activator of Hsp90 ATPase homolog 1-like protein